jgi:hypothetical protein
VPRRRGHNRYRQIYDQELSGRPLVAEGSPCGSCGFPMLSQPVEGQAGRWVHADCSAPPEFNKVAVHLVVHWAQESGEAAESLLERVSDQDLDAAVKEYMSRWHDVRRWAATQSRETSRPHLNDPPVSSSPVPSRPRRLPRKVQTSQTAHRRVATPATVENEATLADTCHVLARRLNAAPPGRARIAMPAPTGFIAEAIAELLEGLAKTVIQPAQSGTGSEKVALCPGVPDTAREQVIDRLTQGILRPDGPPRTCVFPPRRGIYEPSPNGKAPSHAKRSL